MALGFVLEALPQYLGPFLVGLLRTLISKEDLIELFKAVAPFIIIFFFQSP